MKYYILLLSCIFISCNNYLDVVPDNIATIDNAFTSRVQAEKYLFTCYSYLPREGEPSGNPGFNSGDEFWIYWPLNTLSVPNNDPYNIARGLQNKVNPNLNFWDGSNAPRLWEGIRNCNIFLENIDKVADLDPYMKTRWVAEVKFLKAYYHWYLFRMYGPIPIVDKNLSIAASTEEVQVKRQSVDQVVTYIANLIDEAATGLPSKILNEDTELGRMTKAAALAIKARLLVTAASPLFNGNTDFANFKGIDGDNLFPLTIDPNKWELAAIACKAAIDEAHGAGHKLYKFDGGLLKVDEYTQLEMDIRNAVCEKWNTELIWGATPGSSTLQNNVTPNFNPSEFNNGLTAQMAPTFKMVELFYTQNGVPIAEDKNWDFNGRYDLKTAGTQDKGIQFGYETAALHFNREPRFYANVGFDGAKLFMKNKSWDIQAKTGQTSGKRQNLYYSITGYYAKKLINWNMVIGVGGSVSIEAYPWPIVRLADLYLLYAEALNETGKQSESLKYVNLIRSRAGLSSVEESWTLHAINPSKFTTKNGLRSILHQERLIELSFEASRFWDLRRWKEAESILNAPIMGWDVSGRDNATYYRRLLLFNQTFISPRDYFWPIKENNILVNPNLVQNLGW